MRNRKRLAPGETNAANPQGATIAGPHGSEPVTGDTACCTCPTETAPAFCQVHGEPRYRRPTPPLTDAERRLLAQAPPQPSTVPHVVQLVVTFDGSASRVEVLRVTQGCEMLTSNWYPSGDVIASGRSWGDVEKTFEAACLDSQGRTP